jgi:hypothetical protein
MPREEVATRRVRWGSATRIVASRFPPVALFERVSTDPDVQSALIAAEMLVNPRLRDETGEIALVPPEEQVSGPGATWVMAPFTHRNPNGSRFSDGSYGVLYAGNSLDTAVRETAFHFARVARDSADGPRREAMRVLVGRINATFHDAGSLPASRQRAILDPDSYTTSRTFGRQLRDTGSNGIHYASVRYAAGQCLAVFRPTAAGTFQPSRHLSYEWDGRQMSRYFDYHDERWIGFETPFAG